MWGPVAVRVVSMVRVATVQEPGVSTRHGLHLDDLHTVSDIPDQTDYLVPHPVCAGDQQIVLG